MLWILVTAFCINPIPTTSGVITSSYGWRLLPGQPARTFHKGIDIRAKLGTPVRSVRKGKVSFASEDTQGGGGLMVDVVTDALGEKFIARYAHLHKILVKKGDTVKPGQVIGTVGSTGFSTGPHLHFEILTITKDGRIEYHNPSSWTCRHKIDLQVPHFKTGKNKK